MDKTLQQVVDLALNGSIEQRCAVLLVLAALKLQNPEVLKAVAAALDHANPVLKDYALRYLEEMPIKSCVPLLLRLLDDPDKETQERVIKLLSAAGQPAVDALVKHTADGSRLWQLNAARIFCAVRGRAAIKGLLELLISGNDEFNKAVCDLMTPAIRGMDSKEQESLYTEVEAFAVKLDAKQQRPAVVSAMRLMGQLGLPQARRWLFKFIGPEHHATLRSHALVALLHCLRQQDLRKDEHAKLFTLVEEAEFSEITRLVLDLLDAHEVPEDARSLLSRLLQSPHGEIQKFALRKMGAFSTPATVRTLVEQLGDPDYRRRDVAASSLRSSRNCQPATTRAKPGASLSCCLPLRASGGRILCSYFGNGCRPLWPPTSGFRRRFCMCLSKRIRISLVISWWSKVRVSSRPKNTRKPSPFSPRSKILPTSSRRTNSNSRWLSSNCILIL